VKRECIYGIQQGRERERKIYKFRNAINEREERERESKRVRGGEVRTKWHLVFKIRHIKKQRARLKKHTLRRLWFHPED
jgi:hypothetical protein